MRHSVVVSDVHLCEAISGDGLWLRYRQRKFFPDQEFSRLFDWMHAQVKGEELELIFNGDLFDFDAAAVIDGEVRFEDKPRNEAVSVATLSRVLDDHDVFVQAIGRMAGLGHRIVFVSGNHDAQLIFPGVQALLRARIVQAALAGGSAETDEALSSRVIFRPWFYTTPSNVHVEHGNQYDRYCAFRYPTEPFGNDGTSIQPTVGSLTFRHMASRMGYFNPHVDSSFMLSLPQYIKHWFQYYLFSKRSLFRTGIKGIYKTAMTTWRERTKPDSAKEARMIQHVHEQGISPDSAKLHAARFASPAEDAMYGLLRELWIDRVALVGTGALLALGAYHVGTAGTLAEAAIGAGAGITGYEIVVPKPKLNEIYQHVDACERMLADIYGVKGVVFGHTHNPFGKWENGIFFGNSGTWSPSFHDIACTIPLDTGRPVIWLREDDGGKLAGGLYEWREGTLIPKHQPV